MLKSPLLFAISVLVALLSWTPKAIASEELVGLSFDLPPASQVSSPIASIQTAVAPNQTKLQIEPLIRPTQPLPPLTETSLGTQASLQTTTPTDIGVHFPENSLQLPAQVTEETVATETVDLNIPRQLSQVNEQVEKQFNETTEAAVEAPSKTLNYSSLKTR